MKQLASILVWFELILQFFGILFFSGLSLTSLFMLLVCWIAFDIAEGKFIVIYKEKQSLFKDDNVPKKITSKKLNGLNYLAWAHAMKVFLCGSRKLNI